MILNGNTCRNECILNYTSPVIRVMLFAIITHRFLCAYVMQAGIEGKRLRLALEPEAASVYCVTSGVLVRDVGTIYMVVDIGGNMNY